MIDNSFSLNIISTIIIYYFISSILAIVIYDFITYLYNKYQHFLDIKEECVKNEIDSAISKALGPYIEILENVKNKYDEII